VLDAGIGRPDETCGRHPQHQCPRHRGREQGVPRLERCTTGRSEPGHPTESPVPPVPAELTPPGPHTRARAGPQAAHHQDTAPGADPTGGEDGPRDRPATGTRIAPIEAGRSPCVT
jgi:hypothetical protein